MTIIFLPPLMRPARLQNLWTPSLLVGAVLLLLGAATPTAAQTITSLTSGLNFGTVLPGQGAVTIAPWSAGLGGRSAPTFRIAGTAGQVVKVRLDALPTTMENGMGGVVMIAAYVVQFNTAPSASGAVTLASTLGVEQSVTLDGAGVGYLSLGATLSPGVTQTKGAYAFGEGGMVSVLP